MTAGGVVVLVITESVLSLDVVVTLTVSACTALVTVFVNPDSTMLEALTGFISTTITFVASSNCN